MVQPLTQLRYSLAPLVLSGDLVLLDLNIIMGGKKIGASHIISVDINKVINLK